MDPEFDGEFSRGWHFVLPKAFRQELDIRLTERMEDGKKTLRWTQGPFYCFSEGHIIYDTPHAYMPWIEALQHIQRYCRIISATPNQPGPDGEISRGQVFFELLRPNPDRTGTEKIGSYHLTQEDFVAFLKSGELDESKLL